MQCAAPDWGRILSRGYIWHLFPSRCYHLFDDVIPGSVFALVLLRRTNLCHDMAELVDVDPKSKTWCQTCSSSHCLREQYYTYNYYYKVGRGTFMVFNECCRSIRCLVRTIILPVLKKLERKRRLRACEVFSFLTTNLNKPSLHGWFPLHIVSTSMQKTARAGNSRRVIFHSPAVFKRQ